MAKRTNMENRVALRWAGAQFILNLLQRATNGAVQAGSPDYPQPLMTLTAKYDL